MSIVLKSWQLWLPQPFAIPSSVLRMPARKTQIVCVWNWNCCCFISCDVLERSYTGVHVCNSILGLKIALLTQIPASSCLALLAKDRKKRIVVPGCPAAAAMPAMIQIVGQERLSRLWNMNFDMYFIIMLSYRCSSNRCIFHVTSKSRINVFGDLGVYTRTHKGWLMDTP